MTTTTFQLYETKREQMRAWLLEHYVREFELDRFRARPLLDAACGEGFWASLFAEEGFETYGCDSDEEFIAAGREKYPNVDLRVADITKTLPYAADSFGVVFLRGFPQLYAYRITKARDVLARLLALTTDLLLVGLYTDASGEKREGTEGSVAWHHRDQIYLDAASSIGTIEHVARKGNYLQIGIGR